MPFIHKAHEIHSAVRWWKDGDHPSVEMGAGDVRGTWAFQMARRWGGIFEGHCMSG